MVSAINHTEPDPACVHEFLNGNATFVVLAVFGGALRSIFPHTNLDGADNGSFIVMDSLTLVPCSTSNKALVNLDCVFGTDGFTFRPDHASPEFVENLKCGFIAGQAELPLKLKG
jgi:hypothetical protein